jgi:transcriptional antiterminator RfaH
MSSFWTCARTQSFRERIAQGYLERAGFPTYAPRVTERIRIRGRLVSRAVGLFPSYIFVWVELQWHQIYRAPGVVRIIGNDAGPEHVPAGVIDAIRQREVDGLVQLPERQQLQPGTRVRVTGGPLHGLEGLVADMSGSERIGVLLHLLGSQRRIEISKDQVAAAD